MDSQPAVHTFDFPPRLDQAEIENRCARESFTWGPQALWLVCGLIWLFYLVMRDVPEIARNTMLLGLGATVLAALAVWYEMRRRKRQTVLCPLRGRIGCYRGNRFQYSFLPEEMVRVRPDFFGRLMIVFKLLIPNRDGHGKRHFGAHAVPAQTCPFTPPTTSPKMDPKVFRSDAGTHILSCSIMRMFSLSDKISPNEVSVEMRP